MIRSGYSFRHAYGHLKEVATRLDEIGWTRQPLVDRVSTFAFNRWSKMVPAPIFGVELGVSNDLEDKQPGLDFWRFLATDDLLGLHHTIGVATDPRGKLPMLTYAEALEAKGCIKISGNATVLTNVSPRAKDFYVALQPSMPIGLYKAARQAGFKFIATSDNTYPRVDDREIYRIALWRWAGTQTYPQHILSDDEWKAAVAWADEADIKAALKNRAAVFERCQAKLGKATLYKPERKLTLRQMCEAGAKVKGVSLKNKEYASRLDRELELIAQKNFEDYFYIIADLVCFAKQHMVVGPARGSSCGSLVCYLLDITTVDPLKYGLIFERFIDINRNDLPDIDIDFSDAKRQLVFEYAEQKYGRERVARLGTTGMFRPRSILNAAGSALRIPQWRVERVLDSLIVRSSGDNRALQQLEDTFTETEEGRKLMEEYPAIKQSARLENHPQNASQHSAGLVVTAEPIEHFVAIDRRTWAAMCDKKDAEDLNLLKIDMLGLIQLSIFERTLELAGIDFHGYFEKVPLHDQKTFDLFNANHYSGIFQFNGRVLRGLASNVQVHSLEDIVSLTALARPGPIASGGAAHWVKRKNKQEKVEYPHPLFEPYLKDTLGVVCYQEQVMQIGRQVGDLTWEDVTALRKAMSKSLGREYFDQYGDRWKAAAEKKGIPRPTLDKFWEDLCAYGAWAFNKSHAVAYGLVSYYCAYLKAHYPLEFAAATLDAQEKADKQIELLRELAEEGVTYTPFDPDTSELRWTVNKKRRVLVGPLTMIHGVGPKNAETIIKARQGGKPLSKAMKERLACATTDVDSMFPVRDAISRNWPDLRKVGINDAIVPIEEVKEGQRAIIAGVVTVINPKDENEDINVAKRGGKRYTGPVLSLSMRIKDDSGEIYCKIGRFDYERLAVGLMDQCRRGKTIYAIKGTCPVGFRMMKVEAIRYLGEIN